MNEPNVEEPGAGCQVGYYLLIYLFVFIYIFYIYSFVHLFILSIAIFCLAKLDVTDVISIKIFLMDITKRCKLTWFYLI